MKIKRYVVVAASSLFALAGCHKSDSGTTPTPTPAAPAQVDCIAGTPGCAELTISGDAPYTLPNGSASALSGYADPSLRKDPQASTLWLAYSWPNLRIASGTATAAVDTHLATSTDGGATFTFVRSLWPAVATTNPANASQTGYLVNETPNLLPVVENGATVWYAARLSYFSATAGSRPVSSFHIRVYKAATPGDLATATGEGLGCNTTAAAWGITQNLAALNADLADVSLWNEPSLYYENGTLYLVLVGFALDSSGQPIMSRHNVHVFSTVPTGAPTTWQWAYRGKLVDATKEAVELGGQRITQVDIVKGTDGQLLMLGTPDDYVPAEQDYNHKGCKVVEISSLSTPALARDASTGKLKVRAIITASDAGPLGSAASTYDPASGSGLLLTKRIKTSSQLTASIWRTGLKF